MYIPLGERELAKEIEQRGIEKGIEEGIEKGMEEKAKNMARKLLADGVPPEVIARSAEWPVERVRALVN